jgi:hypothetical protein
MFETRKKLFSLPIPTSVDPFLPVSHADVCREKLFVERARNWNFLISDFALAPAPQAINEG